MLRSKLKNIINKSKELSNKQLLVGDSPFELFRSSLPKELDSFKGDNYRLEAAWKAYGSPKNYEEAVWLGLCNPAFPDKMPSIGYNEESDEYEYLNTGKENDTVAKDIRVWDNDVIPLVKELKLGGYVRTFNEEKNCWTYSKNPLKGIEPSENNELQVIDYYQKGGKASKKEKNDSTYAEFIATLPSNLLTGNDGEDGYRMRYAFDNSPNVWTFDDAKGTFINWNDEDKSWHGSSVFGPTGEFLKSSTHPTVHYEIDWYNSNAPEAVEFRRNNELITTDENGKPLKYYRYVPRKAQAFKQGGQMNVIPSGSLHAHKNHMELAEKGEITSKGIPVVDNEGNLLAEIEKEEWTMTKELTDDVEKWYKEYYKEDISQKDKDELAIKCGKRITKELLHNTDDRANLIAKMLEEEE